MVIFCCCCGLGLAILSKGGDDSGDSDKHRSSSSAAASKDPSPGESPSPNESKSVSDDTKKSDGPKTKPVPNVVGKNAAVAADELKQAGFSKVRFAAGDNHKIVIAPQNWEVTKQSAAADSQLRTDAVLVLTCKKVS